MLKTSSSTDAKASQGGTLVVLLAPEALGPHVDPEALSRTLRSAKPARVLIHLVNVDGLPLAAVVEQALVAEQADVQTEWLLGPNVSPLSPSTARLAQMPPGSTTEEQEELALALADVVLVSPALEQTRLFQRAHTLGKTFVSVGAALPEWKPKPSITQCLDPDGPGWLAYWRCVFGRWEQLLLELLAINWLGCNIGGIAESRKRLWRCCKMFGWRPGTYFAPDAWRELCPDAAALTASAPIRAKFEALDRSALYGSYIHRDLIWFVHIAAALAVLFGVMGHSAEVMAKLDAAAGTGKIHSAAVTGENHSAAVIGKIHSAPVKGENHSAAVMENSGAVTGHRVPVKGENHSAAVMGKIHSAPVMGKIHSAPAKGENHGNKAQWNRVWPLFEFGALAVVVFLILVAQISRLQDRWMACRLGAEQLRIARMCLPLLVVPPVLLTVDKPPTAEDTNGATTTLGRLFARMWARETSEFMFQSLAEAKRAVREQGLPRLSSNLSPMQAAEWLKLVVADQADYHRLNHRKLACADRRLLLLTTLLFFRVMVAVGVELWRHVEVSQLVTVFVPALATALHGAGTRLGIVHRSALSEATGNELEQINTELQRLIDRLKTQIDRQPASNEAWRRMRDAALRAADAMGRENFSWHHLVRLERDHLP